MIIQSWIFFRMVKNAEKLKGEELKTALQEELISTVKEMKRGTRSIK